jgi:hypothetical protein
MFAVIRAHKIDSSTLYKSDFTVFLQSFKAQPNILLLCLKKIKAPGALIFIFCLQLLTIVLEFQTANSQRPKYNFPNRNIKGGQFLFHFAL